MTDAQVKAALETWREEHRYRNEHDAMRAALAAAQAEAPENFDDLWGAAEHYTKGFAAGIEAAAEAGSKCPIHISSHNGAVAIDAAVDARQQIVATIRALRPPAAPAGTLDTRHLQDRAGNAEAGLAAITASDSRGEERGTTAEITTFPGAASEPAGANWRKQVYDDVLANIEDWSIDGKRGLSIDDMKELAYLVTDSIPSPEPTGAQDRGACSNCGATWYTPGAILPCPVCTSPETE